MAEVTGTIGNEYVELNNAATEATLRQLLAAVQGRGGNVGATATLAGQAGISPATAKAAEERTKKLTEEVEKSRQTFAALQTGLVNLTSALFKGTQNTSDLFAAFEGLPGVAGMVATGFRRVAQFQQENMEAYQKITDAGVSFGGSLTDMRMAAANTYMTLDQFAGLLARNGETLAKLGTTADQGARAFAVMSNSLLKSEAGDSLRALGFTTEQVNEGMANYLAQTGGRTRQELQNTAAITKSAQEYLTQLDGLAAITGKSREQLEKEQKAAAANAAYQQMMLNMDEKQKAAFNAGLLEMRTKFGKAGEELFIAQSLGIAPQTEAAQKLAAMSPEVAKASQAMADVGKRGGALSETMRASSQATAGAVESAKRFSQVAGPLSLQGGAAGEALMNLTKESNRARVQGAETADAAERQRREVEEEQRKRRESEAKDAAEAQKAMQELGQSIMSALLPVIKLVTPLINGLAKAVSVVAGQFEKLPGIIQALIAALVAYTLFKKRQTMQEALEGGVGGGGAGGKKSLGTRVGEGLFKAGGAASQYAKLGGVAGAVLGGASLYSSMSDINKQVEEGKLSEEEAKKAKAGAIGETGGGVAGGIAGAAAGAAIGSVVPIIGTMIGGLIGGALGSFGGSSLGKSAADAITGAPKMAVGGIVTQPTLAQIGESGPEIVSPLKPIENLHSELQQLNKQTAEMIRYMKETADMTRQAVDATKSLGGDLFKF